MAIAGGLNAVLSLATGSLATFFPLLLSFTGASKGSAQSPGRLAEPACASDSARGLADALAEIAGGFSDSARGLADALAEPPAACPAPSPSWPTV